MASWHPGTAPSRTEWRRHPAPRADPVGWHSHADSVRVGMSILKRRWPIKVRQWRHCGRLCVGVPRSK